MNSGGAQVKDGASKTPQLTSDLGPGSRVNPPGQVRAGTDPYEGFTKDDAPKKPRRHIRARADPSRGLSNLARTPISHCMDSGGAQVKDGASKTPQLTSDLGPGSRVDPPGQVRAGTDPYEGFTEDDAPKKLHRHVRAGAYPSRGLSRVTLRRSPT